MELFSDNLVTERTWRAIFFANENGVIYNQVTGGTSDSGYTTGLRTVGGSIEGGSYASSTSGARVMMFPDPYTGFVAYNAANTKVFEVTIAGAGVGDVTIGNYAGGQGAKYDSSTNTFSITGALSAGSIHIPDQVTANSFHTDSSGNSWWGSILLADANAKILNTGVGTFSNFNLVGGTVSGVTMDIGGADDTSFHVDIDGNIWSGAAVYNQTTNPFAVSSAGVLRATVGVIANWTISTNSLSTGAFATINTMYFGSSGLSLSDKFSVTDGGVMRAVEGTIANWTISTSALSTGAFNTAGNMYFGTSGISMSDAFSVTAAGAISATSGVIGGFTLGATEMYGGTIKTDFNVGIGSNGVVMDSAGLRGYDAILGNTFNLPTDGSAPTFSSGVIRETVFEISTNAVLRTSDTVGDGTVNSAGVLINNTGVYGCGPSQTPATANFRILNDGGGSIVLGPNGFIRGGQTDYNTGIGWFEGYSSGEYKLSMGNPDGDHLNWDGTHLKLKGSFDVGIGGVINNSVYTVANLPVAPTAVGFNPPSNYE